MKDYSEAIKLNAKDAEAYNNRGNAYSLLGKYDQALKDYDEAVKLDPKNARIYGNRGMGSCAKGKTKKRKRILKKPLSWSRV